MYKCSLVLLTEGLLQYFFKSYSEKNKTKQNTTHTPFLGTLPKTTGPYRRAVHMAPISSQAAPLPLKPDYYTWLSHACIWNLKENVTLKKALLPVHCRFVLNAPDFKTLKLSSQCKRQWKGGRRFGSVVECLPSKHEAPSSSLDKKIRWKETTWKRNFTIPRNFISAFLRFLNALFQHSMGLLKEVRFIKYCSNKLF